MRTDLMASLQAELQPLRVLDKYQLTGVLAAWWADRNDDLRRLKHQESPREIDPKDEADSYPYTPDLASALGKDLLARVERLVAAERQSLVDTYLSWGDRNGTSLTDLDELRDASFKQLKTRLGNLGYMSPDLDY